MKIGKTFVFDSAHYLPNHPGKCKNLHGHTYRLELELEGKVDKRTGMLIDFGDLKERVAPVIDRLDHRFLNDFLPTPTAENIALYLQKEVERVLRDYPVIVSRVRVWETPTSYAEAGL